MASESNAVGVLGGGALGLGAALRLAQAGRKVTLIEREPQLGGLAAGFSVGRSNLEKFYHHIFRTDTTIIGFIKELGLDGRLVWGRPNTSTLSNGRIVSLGTIPDLLRLPLLNPVDRFRFLSGMAVLKAIPNELVFKGWTAARWMPRLMGRRVYSVMWEPVLRGNRSIGNDGDGLFVCWRVRYGLFEANEVRENRGSGISIGHKDSDNLFRGNTITGNG